MLGGARYGKLSQQSPVIFHVCASLPSERLFSCCCHLAACGLRTDLLLLCICLYLSTQKAAVNSQLPFLPLILCVLCGAVDAEHFCRSFVFFGVGSVFY